MLELGEIPDSELKYTTRAFKRLAKKRGWKSIKRVGRDLTFLLATRPDGRVLPLYSATPPTTSAFALTVANDKFATYELLEAAGIRQPKTILFSLDSQNRLTPEAKKQLKALLADTDAIVIKPLDEGHGHGITTGVRTQSQLQAAITKAAAFRHDATMHLLAQEQISACTPEIRVICINYQFVLAVARIPACVTGDGQHTVRELIDHENATLRTAPYESDLAYIDTDSALTYLGTKANAIPAKGEKVCVSGTCNLGQGGTVQDVTTTVSKTIKKTSEVVARALELPVAGIDFFGDYIIEVNPCPSLYYPLGSPASELAVLRYLEYLEQLP